MFGRFSATGLVAFLAVSVTIAVARLGLGAMASGPVSEQEQAVAQAGPKQFFFGTAACVRCHNDEKPREDKDFPPLCRCTEMRIWQEEDKHRKAYQMLTSDRGQQMARLLGWDVTETKHGCVSCHAVAANMELQDKTFRIDEGVSCVVCHGPYEDWVDEHGSSIQRKRERWRARSRAEKETETGMTDLWDPVKRAKLCVSCHVGNAADGKVVTHEMYAAGHPPLPSIEVATFSDVMPRHWEYLHEKKPAVLKSLHFDDARKLKEQPEEVKLVLVGAAVSLAEAMKLLAAQAEKSAQADQPADRILDLASFDCYACHHELKSPSWRAKRGYVGQPPGRPMPRPWPTALVEVAVRHVAADDADAERQLHDLDQTTRQLYATFAARPLGDPKTVSPAAAAVAAWAEQLAANLNDPATRYDQTAVLKLLRACCSPSDPARIDYDSARQIAWAFQTIYEALTPKPAADGEIREILAKLKTELHLMLPAGQKHKILDELPGALDAVGNYDPRSFQKRLAELAQLLPER
jgi:cytochrome c553